MRFSFAWSLLVVVIVSTCLILTTKAQRSFENDASSFLEYQYDDGTPDFYVPIVKGFNKGHYNFGDDRIGYGYGARPQKRFSGKVVITERSSRGGKPSSPQQQRPFLFMGRR